MATQALIQASSMEIKVVMMGAGRTRTALNDHALSSFYPPNPMMLAGRNVDGIEGPPTQEPLPPKLNIQILCLARSPCPRRYRNLLPRPFSTRSYRRHDACFGTTMPVLGADGLAIVWPFFLSFHASHGQAVRSSWYLVQLPLAFAGVLNHGV